jgi:hypothetical protein
MADHDNVARAFADGPSLADQIDQATAIVKQKYPFISDAGARATALAAISRRARRILDSPTPPR